MYVLSLISYQEQVRLRLRFLQITFINFHWTARVDVAGTIVHMIPIS